MANVHSPSGQPGTVKTDGPSWGTKQPRNSSEKAFSSLPEVYKASFFKSEELTEKQISARINLNPIISLCLKLSTIDINSNGTGCSEFRGETNRLYKMIGRKLGRPAFLRMYHSSSQQYDFVEDCWIANMHTVLLNQDFNPVKFDRKLFRAIRSYKIWFVKFFFAGKLQTYYQKIDKRRKVIFLPLNFERGLKSLKNFAGYLQWFATSDCKEVNKLPPDIPFWRGWNSSSKRFEQTWFDGHLLKWKYPFDMIGKGLSDAEISNLAQIRTFGRALPCPTKKMCRLALEEQVSILSKEFKTPENVLRTVKHFSRQLGSKLGIREMPLSTHVSVSTSGCFERSQKEFGIAGEVSSWIQKLDIPINQFRVRPSILLPGNFPIDFWDLIMDNHNFSLVDCYGENLFPRTKGYYLFLQEETTLLSILYGGLGSTAKRDFTKSLIGQKTLPPELGKIMLMLASIESLKQGYFVSDIDDSQEHPFLFLETNEVSIPMFKASQMRYHLLYQPTLVPKTKLTCLAEPGAKTRPLGKNQAWFTIVTRAMRFMAEPIIARDGRARIGLRSTNKMWSFLKYIKARGLQYEDPICQSTDYKSATDLIPLDLIEAMWSGFLTGLPKRHPFWVFYRLITCQRRMFFPKRTKIGLLWALGLLNERGSFMGEPMSFLTLSLENLVVEEITCYYYYNKLVLWTPIVETNLKLVGDAVCICGDDVAALRRCLMMILLFREVFTAMGWEASWKDAVSKRLLIFCEDHALLQGKGKTLKMVYIDIIKSRLLTTMSREHSDNRSSILGKGRMLGNQLDYFQDKNLKIAVLSYYSQIIEREYTYKDYRCGIKHNAIRECKFPLYTPPCCGGLGIPVVDELIPSWLWPYIGHVFELLKLEDFHERFLSLEKLSSLNSRVKHGITSKDWNIISSEISRYKFSASLQIEPNTIYNDDFIISLIEGDGTVVPRDPYTGVFDFSSLKNEASILGFVQFTELTDQIERVLNFQEFFSKNKVREPRTFNHWVKDSKNYWRGIFGRGPKKREYLSLVGKTNYKGMSSLEKDVKRSFSGWIYVGESRFHLNLINSGPSLKINLSRIPIKNRTIKKY